MVDPGPKIALKYLLAVKQGMDPRAYLRRLHRALAAFISEPLRLALGEGQDRRYPPHYVPSIEPVPPA